ncbi:hypothetical protein BS330_27505 [Amycolatopsis keratiniphila subsp. nogabecina]|nr:hypothetical protein BS330_27505 [Amycolatopsis keratiniphila subsp. nogabecina]
MPGPSSLQTVAGDTRTRCVRSLIIDDISLVNLSISLEILHIPTVQLQRSVRFYLAVGCEVRRSGDGWGEAA